MPDLPDGPVLPLFPRAARLSGAVGDGFAANRAVRRNALHRRSFGVISAIRGYTRRFEFADHAADFVSTGSYTALKASLMQIGVIADLRTGPSLV